MNRRVVIDCDPGIDDCFALLMCIKHLDVIGITAVGGNTQLQYTEKNARYITELAGRPDIPVYAGYDKPMINKLTTAAEIHGSGGLGTICIKPPEKPLEKKHGVDYLSEVFMDEEDVALITLGPLTNVAQAILKQPELKKRIPEICMMGGSVTAGNYNAAAEFNIYVDPEAAKIVFEAGIPIKMAGLNLTRQNCMTWEDVEALGRIGNAPSRFAKELLAYSVSLDGRACLCDACAVAWMIEPDIIRKSIPMHVAVETKGEYTRGMTVCDCRDYMGLNGEIDIERERQLHMTREAVNAEVAMELDGAAFKRLLFDTLAMYK